MSAPVPSRPAGNSSRRVALRKQLALLFLVAISFSASAQYLRMVKDINTQGEEPPYEVRDLDFSNLVDVNGTLFFVIRDFQLWKASAGGGGATLVREFEDLSQLRAVGSQVYFTAFTE